MTRAGTTVLCAFFDMTTEQMMDGPTSATNAYLAFKVGQQQSGLHNSNKKSCIAGSFIAEAHTTAIKLCCIVVLLQF